MSEFSTVQEWAEYFRANPDHLISLRREAHCVSARRYDQDLVKEVGPRLGGFSSMLSAYDAIKAARELAAAPPVLPPPLVIV